MPRSPESKSKRKRSDVELTLERFLDLTLGPTPEHPGAHVTAEAEGRLRDVYRAHRDSILRHSTLESMPWGFWMFEPDVPDELRAEPSALREVIEDPDEEKKVSARLARGEDTLERSRRSWLARRPDVLAYIERLDGR
jgi:hypothetical protein